MIGRKTMSENYGSASADTSGESGKVDAAKQEAKDLAATASAEAGDVVGSAREQASAVAHEAKTQAKDLYRQTTRELRDQAAAQQQRVAEGLHTVGDQLGSMADNAEEPGVASDVVRQVSQRIGSAAAWLGDRDPGSVLEEVKRFARRKPGTFIAVAAVAGVVVGRLTRSLAASAKDEQQAQAAAPRPISASAPITPPIPETPTYDRLAPHAGGAQVGGSGYVGPDSL